MSDRPTYVLMNIYPGHKPVYHLDAYRVAGPGDFEAVGFEEILSGSRGIAVVEWASRVEASLPADRVAIMIEHSDTQVRQMRITGLGPRSAHLLQALENARAGIL